MFSVRVFPKMDYILLPPARVSLKRVDLFHLILHLLRTRNRRLHSLLLLLYHLLHHPTSTLSCNSKSIVREIVQLVLV